MSAKKTVIIFIHYYLPGYESGGPVKSVANIVELLGHEFDFRLITLGWDLKNKTPYTSVNLDSWNDIGLGKVWYFGGSFSSFFKLFSELRKIKGNLAYVNSLFDPFFSLLPLLAFKIGILRVPSIILAPRGELSPGAYNIKRLKKEFYIKVFNFLGFKDTVKWHASTEMERLDILHHFKSASNIYIACDLATLPSPLINFLSENSLVFISRITPKKNLSYALKALALCKSDLTFNIYGTIEDQVYWEECQQLIKDLPVNIRTIFHGQLRPEDVIPNLQKHSLFFFPTLGENYGHVIAEALAAGLPVLLSDQTPWGDVENGNAGWVRPLDNPQAFADVIDNFANLNSDKRIELNKRVIAYAEKKLRKLSDIEDNRILFNIKN